MRFFTLVLLAIVGIVVAMLMVQDENIAVRSPSHTQNPYLCPRPPRATDV
jgi:hypothetical protein